MIVIDQFPAVTEHDLDVVVQKYRDANNVGKLDGANMASHPDVGYCLETGEPVKPKGEGEDLFEVEATGELLIRIPHN